MHSEVPGTSRYFRAALFRAIVSPSRAATTEKKKYKIFLSCPLFGIFAYHFTLGMADSAPVDAVDLTDDQIQQLLLEAEGRLRGPNALATQDDDAALRYGIPILQLGIE